MANELNPLVVAVLLKRWNKLADTPEFDDESRLSQLAGDTVEMADEIAFLRELAGELDRSSTKGAWLQRAAAAEQLAKTHADVPGMGLVPRASGDQRGHVPSVTKTIQTKELEQRIGYLSNLQKQAQVEANAAQSELNAARATGDRERIQELEGAAELKKGTARAAAANTRRAVDKLAKLLEPPAEDETERLRDVIAKAVGSLR